MVLFGMSSYLPFFSVLGSHNYWIHFYSITFTTIATVVLNAGETLAVLLTVPLLKRRPLKFCVQLGYMINLVCLGILPFFKYINDYYLRYILTIIPIAGLGLAAGFVFTAINNVAVQLH